MSSSTKPRRSARIAAKNASKMYVAPTSFTLSMKPNPQPTEIDAQLCEYEKLLEAARCAAPHMMNTVRAIRKLMSFLLWNTAFLDSLSDAQIQEVHGWMLAFHTAHDKWNQEFAENMMNAVRSNKDYFIDMKADAFNPGNVMNVLRHWEPYHNVMTATHIDVEVVYESICHRL